MSQPFLRHIIEERAANNFERNFLTFGEIGYTYGQIDQNSNRVANLLRELNLGPNERVAIFLPNGPEFIFCWFASIKLNITMVPLNTQLKGEALSYIVGHAAPQAVITSAGLLKELQAVAPALPPHCRIVIVGQAEPETRAEQPWETFSFEQLMSQAPTDRPPDVPIKEDDMALIIYTSGTTGHPKGVIHSRRVQTNHPQYYHPELIQTTPDETAYTFLPLFHVTSMCVTMGSFVGGSRLTLDHEFNVFGFWERIRRANAVVFPYLGAVLSMLYSRPPREDDRDNPARWALGGAAPKEIWADFERRFGVRILETYGQTEWGSIWVRHPIYRGEGYSRIGAAGKAPERASVQIVDEDGQPLPAGTPGQIAMKPASPGLMMSGYYQNPELNAQVFRDGWFFTGDVGELDEDGYLYFRGRLSDYIRRRGENIAAYQVESVVNSHPVVATSAAVGVPSELGEEEVMICVVLKDGQSLEPTELARFCRQNLPAFMVPRYIKFLPDLPRTQTQRTRKFILVEAGTAGAWDRKGRKNKKP